MRDRLQAVREEIDAPVFGVSAVLILGFVVFAVVDTDRAAAVFEPLRDAVTTNFGWLLVVGVTGLLAFSVWMAFSRYGKVKLGPDDSTPDYSTLSWFSMLFAAGMGIGLMYWGVAEPISYYLLDPPLAAPGTEQAATDAMRFSFHHWGFSPWAMYAVIGLGLAYFGYRHDQPMQIRTLFRPLLGDRVDGLAGSAIDILAVLGTMFGVATSLGFGVMQVNAGLNDVFGVEISITVQLLLVAGITLMATASVVSGLDKGIQRLSQINIGLAGLALLFVLVTGPTLYLISAYVDNTGNYLSSALDTMLWTGAYNGGDGWLDTWTLFYWAWWASWSPFVGMFIARISRGRTIRQFIAGTLLVPSLVGFLWFTVFGNAAIWFQDRGADIAGVIDAEEEGEALAMFALLGELPLTTLTSIVATILVVLFFVTSSDSGSFVIDMLTSGGDLDPSTETRIFWSLTEGAVASALLLAGGLTALQAMSLATGLPFTIVLLFGAWSIVKGLRQEFRSEKGPRQPVPPAHLRDATRREREARELELRTRELETKERELDVRERELDEAEAAAEVDADTDAAGTATDTERSGQA